MRFAIWGLKMVDRKEGDKKYYREHRVAHDVNSNKWAREHPEKKKKIAREWYHRNKRQAESSRLKSEYGITIEDYDKMYLKQEGKCAGCKTFHDVLCVDHNHKTGKIRGLLCRKCNSALGFVEDNVVTLENLIALLRAGG
jgi:hypothetical protein